VTVTTRPLPPDFSISAEPGSVSVQQGSSGQSAVTVQSLNGFSGLVGFSCENAPAGVTCGFDPNPVTIFPGGSRNSTLAVSVAADAVPGTYFFDVKGTGLSITHSSTLMLTVTQRGR
jgi:hypothetical protein